MRTLPHKEKRLHVGGVGPRLLTLAGLEPTPEKETPLSGRRASNAIAGGVSGGILPMSAPSVKRSVCLPQRT